MAATRLRTRTRLYVVMLNASFALPGGLCRPNTHVRDEFCIGGFPNEDDARKAERFTLLATGLPGAAMGATSTRRG